MTKRELAIVALKLLGLFGVIAASYALSEECVRAIVLGHTQGLAYRSARYAIPLVASLALLVGARPLSGCVVTGIQSADEPLPIAPSRWLCFFLVITAGGLGLVVQGFPAIRRALDDYALRGYLWRQNPGLLLGFPATLGLCLPVSILVLARPLSRWLWNRKGGRTAQPADLVYGAMAIFMVAILPHLLWGHDVSLLLLAWQWTGDSSAPSAFLLLAMLSIFYVATSVWLLRKRQSHSPRPAGEERPMRGANGRHAAGTVDILVRTMAAGGLLLACWVGADVFSLLYLHTVPVKVPPFLYVGYLVQFPVTLAFTLALLCGPCMRKLLQRPGDYRHRRKPTAQCYIYTVFSVGVGTCLVLGIPNLLPLVLLAIDPMDLMGDSPHGWLLAIRIVWLVVVPFALVFGAPWLGRHFYRAKERCGDSGPFLRWLDLWAVAMGLILLAESPRWLALELLNPEGPPWLPMALAWLVELLLCYFLLRRPRGHIPRWSYPRGYEQVPPA